MSKPEGYLTNPLYREVKSILDRAGIPFRVEAGARHWLIIYRDQHGQEWKQPLHLGPHLRVAIRRKTVKRFQKIASGFSLSKPGNGAAMSQAATRSRDLFDDSHGEPILRLVADAMSEAPLPDVVDGSIGDATIQTVNARHLHRFLEVGKDFSNWIRDRISTYQFIENVDYLVFAEIGENPQGGRPSKEYAISLDMAKELSMVERNEKGKQARRYFIECERKVKSADPMAAALQDPAYLRKALLVNVEKVLELRGQVKVMRADVDAFDRIAKADGSLCITDAAKALQIQPKVLFTWLSTNGWTYRRTGNKNWLGYEAKRKSGFLIHKVDTVPGRDGEDKITERVRVTAKGLAALAKIFPPALAAE